MTQLIINRSSAWANKLRDIKIFLDDVEVAQIADGCSQTLNLPPGDYEIHAKVDWCCSKQIAVSLKEGDQKEINLSGYKFSNHTHVLALLFVAGSILYDYLELPRTFGYNPLIITTLIVFAVNVYYITFGRKKYLRLNPST